MKPFSSLLTGVSLALMVALTGCADGRMDLVRSASEVAKNTEQPIAVGNDLVGEACRAVPSADSIDALGAAKTLDVKCGTWTKPSGRLSRIDRAATPDELLKMATSGAWRADIDGRLNCGEPKQTTILNGLPAVWLKCSRRAGGLPYVAFVASVNGKIVLADGLPPSQPPLEALAAQQAGLAAADIKSATSASSATELLKEQFGGKMVGNADRAQYDRLMQLGRGFNNEGNYSEAVDYYREALKLQQQLMGANNPDQVQPMMHLAVVLSNNQRYTESNQLFAKCDELIKKLNDPAIAAMLTYYKAINLANQGKHDEAKKLSTEAAGKFEQLSGSKKAANKAGRDNLFVLDTAQQGSGGSKVNSVLGEVESTAFTARLYRRDGDLKASQAVIEGLRPTVNRNRDKAPNTFANVYSLSGVNRVDLGDKDVGEKEVKEAIGQLDTYLANTLPQARAYFTLGRVLRTLKKSTESLTAFRTAARIAEEKNFTFPVEIIFPYMDALYEEAQRPGANPSDLYAEMFAASQLARSGAAAQFVADAAAQLAQGSGESANAIRDLRERQSDFGRLQSKIDSMLALPQAQQDSGALAEMTAQLKQIEKDRDEAETKVQAVAPNFNMLRLKTITAADVIKVMRPGEAVYYILLGTDHSYGFLIHEGKVTAFAVALNYQTARDAVDAIRDAVVVRIGSSGPEIAPFQPKESYQLYLRILAPVEKQLEGVKKLIVAQTGALLSMPFAMLVAKDPPSIDGLDYRNVDFLIRHFAIGYVTSMQSFVILREAATTNRAPRPFFGFGDYVQPSEAFFRRHLSDPQCADDLEAMLELGPLPGTRGEVMAAAKTMSAGPNDVKLGTDFTKASIGSADLVQYRVIHFATHALLPTDLKCRSNPTMLVSAPPGSDEFNDVFFDTGEILKLKLNADLVVLSACNTSSQGQLGSGESLSGLAQAFFVSGARGLVVSQWLAADQSTVQLMTHMYQEIAKGKVDTANALRDAQLQMLETAGKQDDVPLVFTHPLFWSVFTPVGDGFQPDPVKTAQLQ